MGNVLVVAEQRDGELKKPTMHAISAARVLAEKTGGVYFTVVVGSGVDKAAKDVAKYGGEKVFAIDAPHFKNYLAQSYAHAVADVAKEVDAEFVCVAATTFGKDVLPRIAVRLGGGMVSDVLEILGQGAGITFKRPMWAGNVIAEVKVGTKVKALSIRQTEFDAAAPAGKEAAVTSFTSSLNPASLRMEFAAFNPTISTRPELTEARVIVSGGRGLKDAEGFKIVEKLADTLNAAVGATRAAVDSGFCPNDLQVGQTGKVVAPELYVAVALSGAIQHVSGMKGSKVIVAINKDEEAPIFEIADYGLVADAFKAVPELLQAIQKHKG